MGKKGKKRDLFAVTQKIVIYNDHQEILIVRSADDQDGLNVIGKWDLAGGHIEYDENNLEESLMREVQEELGENLMCELKGPFICRRRDYEGQKRVCVGVLAKYISGDIVIDNKELVDHRWESMEDIEKNKEYKPWLKEFATKAQQHIEQIEAHDRYMRLLADFDNFKKRQVESQKDFAQYASENVIRDMLPVLDNFHAATGHVPEDQKDSPWLTGIMYIQQQMDKVFEDQGVTEIKIKIGDAFDTEVMEATEVKSQKSKVKSEGKDSGDEKVQKIVQKGYKIKDKILRPARVVVE